ncbi:formylglycine-generating enzyme family protein [Marinobacter mangrovi]|uniref:formylglycine-generating enzyme family protein n=1 Tax=Marinobacter mangrovi TaxID=2803918 RepID=UPI001933A09C|nr:SUMF1/EgtB/PvdO family nonheme iron enzyme [Marinobacter mangrovi]
MRIKLFRSLPFFALLTAATGCSYYYDSKADEMVQRQMDAMVFVKGGEFIMGNPGGWDTSEDSLPPHKVKLDDFYIQKYEVTQGDFELFQSVTGYKHSNRYYQKKRDEKTERYDPELPAVTSWTDSMAFCKWLGGRSGKPVTLPTEAQWEYAARAGGRMLRYATKNGKAIAGITMADGPTPQNVGDRTPDKMLPKESGSFPPNPLGLFDMSGNVSEWVYDKYDKNYYENSPVINPIGPTEGEIFAYNGDNYRVTRGGTYQDFMLNTTVSRDKMTETLSTETSGFRCALSPSSQE